MQSLPHPKTKEIWIRNATDAPDPVRVFMLQAGTDRFVDGALIHGLTLKRKTRDTASLIPSKNTTAGGGGGEEGDAESLNSKFLLQRPQRTAHLNTPVIILNILWNLAQNSAFGNLLDHH